MGDGSGGYNLVATSTLGLGGSGAVDSVFGRTGVVTAQSGDYTTDLVTEGSTNLYFTNARADARAVTVLSATTTLPNITTLANLSTISTSLTGFVKATAGVLTTAAINLASDITGILPVANGGTGWNSIAANTVLIGNGSGKIATTSAGTNGQVLGLVGGVPTWVSTTTLSTISGTLAISKGGTGTTTAPSYGQVLVGDASGNYELVATSSLGIQAGVTSVFGRTGAVTAQSGDYTTDLVTEGSNLYFTPTRATANFVSNLAATTSVASIISLPSLSLPLSQTTGTLGVANGGTGSTTLTGILKGNGTGGVQSAIPGTDYLTTATLSAVTSLQQTYGSAQTGAITLATSSAATSNGVTVGQTITNSSGTFTFTPTVSVANIPNAALQNSSITVNGTLFNLGDTHTITAASSTLLADNNTWSGSNTFSSTITGSITGNAGTVTNGVYTTTFGSLFYNLFHATTTDALAEGATNLYFTTARATSNFITNLAATTSVASITTLPSLSLPYSQLTGTPTYESPLTFTYPLTRSTNTISLAFGTTTANSWSALQTFANASSTLTTLGTTWLTGLTDALLATDANGKLVATTSLSVSQYLAQANASTNGYLSSSDWNLFNNKISSTSLSASGPLSYNGGTGVFSLSFDSTLQNSGGNLGLNLGNANTWTALQQFNANASTTQLSAGNAYFGTTATSSFATNGALTLVNALTYGGVTLSNAVTGTGNMVLSASPTLTGTLTAPIVRGGTAAGSTLTLRGTTAASPTAGTAGIIFDYGASGTSEAGRIDAVSGFLGLGTTSPAQKLSVQGNVFVSGNISNVGNITATGTANVANLTVGSVSGFLKASAGVVSTALIDLGSDVTGTLAQGNGGTGITSYTPGDVLYADGSGNLVKLPVGGDGTVLKIQAGLPAWGTDQTIGGGGSDGIFATSSGRIYPIDSASVVLVGTSATSTANSIFEVSGQQYISTKLGIATTNPATALSVGGNGYLTGGLGVGVFNSVAGTLRTSGDAAFGGEITVDGTGTSTFAGPLSLPNLALTNNAGLLKASAGGYITNALAGTDYQAPLTAGVDYESPLTFTYPLTRSTNTISLAFGTTTSNTWDGTQTFTNSPVFSSLSSNGLVASNGGALYNVSTSSLDANITGNAGTVTNGVYTTTFGTLFYNLFHATTTDALAEGVTNLYFTTARATANFVSNLAATTSVSSITTLPSLSLPLSQTTGTLGVANGGTGSTTLTGILKGNGTGGVQTAVAGVDYAPAGSYLTTAVTSIGPAGQLQTGPAVTIASSTASFNGLTLGLQTVGAGNTLTNTPTITGTLNNAGLTNSTISGIALGSNLANLSATNATLTFSGTYNGSTARTVGLNLGNANTWTALQTFGNSSTTAASFAYASSTQGYFGTLNLPNTTNALLSTNASGQVVATTSVGVNYLTGTLGVANGGTGSTTLGGILTGNGTGAVTSASVSAPLSFSGNTLSISQANASTNGYLSSSDWNLFNNKISSTSLSAGSGINYNSSTGVISNTGLLSLQQTYGSAQTGAITLATSSANTTTGLSLSENITNSSGTFTFAPTLSGTLNVANGGTNATSQTTSGVNYFDGTKITSGSSLVFDGTHLGVGTTSPTSRIHSVVTDSTSPLTAERTGANAVKFQVTVGGNSLGLIQNSLNQTWISGAVQNSGYTISESNAFGTNDRFIIARTTGNVGIGTTTPAQTLSVQGNALISGDLTSVANVTATGTVKFTGLTSGAVGVNSGTLYTAATTTAGTGLTYSAGAFNVNTTQNITKLSNLTSNGLVKTSGGDGTLSIATAGTDYENPLTFTYPLSRSTNTISLAFGTTTANSWSALQQFANASTTLLTAPTAWITKLANLATAGFVKTASDGTLSVDTNTYLTSSGAVTSIAQTYGSGQVGAITLATSSAATSNGVTVGQTITNSSGTFTFTPTVSVANIPNSALQNSTISGIALGSNLNALTATDSTLTFSGSYNGSTARTVGLNLGNANTWTALQQFNANASTTQFTSTGNTWLAPASGQVAIGTTTFSSNTSLTIATTTTRGLSLLSLGAVYANEGFGSALFKSGTTNAAPDVFIIDKDNSASRAALQIQGNGGTTEVAFFGSNGNVGIGTTSPFATLSVAGNIFANSSITGSNITATGTLSVASLSSLANASTTGFTNSGTTWLTGLTSALLSTDANGKVVATTTLGGNISVPAANITGTLGVANGGTGSTTLGGILAGNGTSAVKSVTIGSGLTWDGTTLATTGSGITQIGPAGQLQSGGTQTLATTTSSFNGLTSALTITASGNTQTFTPSLSGTLTVGGGGTGATSFTANGLLFGNGTSALGVTNSANNSVLVTDGSGNPSLSTTLPTAVQNNISATNLSNFATAANSWIATIDSDSLAEGPTNLYFTNARVNSYINASTTIPKTYTSNSFTALQQFTNATTTLLTAPTAWITKLANLASAGFVKTDSSGNLSVDTNTYLTSSGAVTSLKQTYGSAQTGAITLATSSAATSNGVTVGQTITNSSGTFTFTPTVSVANIPNAALQNSNITVNGTLFNLGESHTITAASSTLLSDNNTWSGSNTFSAPLTLSGTSGTTTIASGQGFTVGSSQFVVQQGSGNVALGTLSPTALFHIGGTYTTSNNAIEKITSNFNSSITGSQYGLYVVPTFNPTGASVGTIAGVFTNPTISASAPINATNLIGYQAVPETLSGYTGTVTNAYGFYASAPTVGAGNNPFTNSTGFYTAANTNGDATTSGSINNYGFRYVPATASAGAGGSINNSGFYAGVPTGSGAGTTNNFALRITGTGGSGGAGTTNNWSLYNDSAENSYFASTVSLGDTGKIYPSALWVATSSTATAQSQIAVRSARAAIVAGNLIGGLDFYSDDTNLTAPGTRVASIQAVANTTHTASALGTDLTFNSTNGTTYAELARLSGAGNFGIGTTSPSQALSVQGNALISGDLTSVANVTATGTVKFTGLTSGAVGVNSGTLYTAATTTAGTGLTYSAGAFNVNTSQNISTLSNLTTNGLVTTSGGTGALSVTANSTNGFVLAMSGGVPTWVATSSINNGVSSLQQTYGSAQTGAITLATSSAATSNGVTVGQTITNASGTFTFTPTVSVANIPNSALQNSTISGIALGSNLANLSATDSTLTFSGTYNGSTARTIGLNLGNANTWTALQTFGNASSTLFSSTYASSTNAFFGTVGIGSTTPSATLSVNGVTGATPSISVRQAASQTGDYLNLYNSSGTKVFSVNQFGNVVGTGNALQFAAAQLSTNSAASPTLTVTGIFGGGQTADIIDIGQNSSGYNSVVNRYGQFAIGTTSTPWQLEVGTSSAGALFHGGQFALSDTSAGANLKHWVFSSENGSLYISSSSDAYATSSVPAFAIDVNGNPSFARALGVSSGGTGATSFTSSQLVYGNGTSALTSVATTSFAAANSTLTVTGTLGALVGGSNSTIGLNLGNANTWTALQQFNGNASTTQLSASSQFFGNNTDSATAPSYSWTSDPTTGMYRLAANKLGFSTGGTERMRIDDSGNVGIGVTANPSTNLQVKGTGQTIGGVNNVLGILTYNGSGADLGGVQGFSSGAGMHAAIAGLSNAGAAAGYMAFYTNAGGGNAERLRITSAGLVGIGTTSPTQALSVQGSALFSGDIQAANITATGTLAVTGTAFVGNLIDSGLSLNTLVYSNISRQLASVSVSSPLSFSAGTLSLGGTVGIANGGTGTTTFYAGGVLFSDGSKLTQSAAAGNFYWDETNKRLGLGTTTPQGPLAIQTASNQTKVFTIANSVGSTTFQLDTTDTSGNIFAVATSTGTDYFDVTANGTINFNSAQYASCTSLTTNGTGIVQCSVSDERLKQDIVALPDTSGLAAITALNPVSYTFRDPARPQRLQYGLIAQQVQQVFPNLVATSSPTALTPDGTLTVDYNGLFAPIVKSIQELNTRTKFISSLASSTALSVDALGNFGVKAAVTNRALSVGGDVGVNGTVFANAFSITGGGQVGGALGVNNITVSIATTTFSVGTTTITATLPSAVLTASSTADLGKLATYTLADTQALAVKVDALTVRMDSLESRLAKLENGAVGESTTTPLTLSTSTLADALQSFGVYIENGLAQFNTLVASRFVAATDSAGQSSAGSGVIPSGNTVVEIDTSYTEATSKILITMTAPVDGSWYLSDKLDGSFRVHLAQPQDHDVTFDYFIIQTEGQINTQETSATPAQDQAQQANPHWIPLTHKSDATSTDAATTTNSGTSTSTPETSVEPSTATSTISTSADAGESVGAQNNTATDTPANTAGSDASEVTNDANDAVDVSGGAVIGT
ncbi:MAG TPA: tail fiber domain-containing protein [Candidatus Paceibacterota bacterium]|nr:tail fiber domain-containing protein [Candidatus Paceibacterota bacterium]